MPSESAKPPLRVAVLVESLNVPEWVRWTVAQIDAGEAFELAAVIPARDVNGVSASASPRKEARHLPYLLYERVDAMVFGAGRAMSTTDLSLLSSGRMTLADARALDVVVSFLPLARTAWDGPAPRYGVWAIDPMDDGAPASATSRFWELRGSNATAATALVAVGGDVPRVITRGSLAADPLSLARTRDSAAWTSARLVVRSLRSLQRDGTLSFWEGDSVSSSEVPGPAITARHAARTALRGVAAKSRTIRRRGEWFVAVRRRSSDGPDAPALLPLPNPAGRYLADPFPIEVDGGHFLFVEDYSFASGRGVISVLEARPDGTWSPPRAVLECEHHLSYPFVFEHEGAIFLVPETGEAGRVELYRSVRFPDVWQRERVLLDGLTAVDATLHFGDGLVWLFANVVEGYGDRGELWLYSSLSLDGEWVPHPQNPIVTDPGTARPAGRLFRRGPDLIRPGQDCSHAYGAAVVLSRVDVLTPHEYGETPVDRIDPDWMPGLERTHTYTLDSRYEWLDGYRHVPRLRIGRRSLAR